MGRIPGRFGAVLVTNTGKAFTFDSVDCLREYVERNDGAEVRGAWVVNAAQPGTLIPAEDAVYVQQGAVRPHMVVFVDGRQVQDRQRLSDPVTSNAEIYVATRMRYVMLAFGVSRLLSLILFDVQPRDPQIFGGVVAVLAMAGLLATILVLTPARKSVRRGSFETLRALIRHIERYLADWNAHPTPFVWTKDPATIIKKALRRAH